MSRLAISALLTFRPLTWLRRPGFAFSWPTQESRFSPLSHVGARDTDRLSADVFNMNHDIYANSPAVIGDLRRLLKEGQRPPKARTPALVKVPAAGGVYWRYKAQ